MTRSPIPTRSFLFLATALAAAVCFGTPLPQGDPAALGFSPERIERLDRVFETYVTEHQLPGAVALVARRGQLVHLGVYGEQDIEQGVPMASDTIFRIASQTKAIVSVGIMMLQEEGKLLIKDPVGKYIPAFNETTVAEPTEEGGYTVVPAKRKITIRDLLTHTSGIGYGYGLAKDEWAAAGIQGWYFADRGEPIADTVERMAALPFESQPGEKWVYGYSIDILGVVIERASGQPLDRFLQERIFDPLGMVDTHFYLPREKRGRLATVYSKTNDEPLEPAPAGSVMVSQGDYVFGPRMSFSGGAGLLSTANDYASFLQMLLNGGEFNGHRLLAPSTVALMTVDHLPAAVAYPWDAGTGFGLGFKVLKDLGARGKPGAVGEFGWGGAYHSDYWIDPSNELVVVYFSQVIPAQGLDDHDKLRALVYQAMVE